MRLNIGCGQSPTPGWRNYDNSLSLRFARTPRVSRLLGRVGVLSQDQLNFIDFARENEIHFGDAVRGLPLPTGSVEAIYSSHMLEHLDQREAGLFLDEARRLLAPGGVIRIAVPDLARLVSLYLETQDADLFLTKTQLAAPRLRSFQARAARALVGNRNHQWMYDGASLCRMLSKHGFLQPQVKAAGETQMPDPGELNLHERDWVSVYVEAEEATN